MKDSRPIIPGEKFSRWTVVKQLGVGKCMMVECLCDCGTIKAVTWNSLKRGLTNSCGCRQREYVNSLPKGNRMHA